MSLEPLQAPAWIVALGTAFFLGAKAVVMVRGGSQNGHLAPELRTALQAVTITLTALTERLAHLPTKDELLTIAEKNRHDSRNVAQGVQGVVLERIDRAEMVILKEIARPA